jgi:heme-degrading monooxygenase HmoA
MVAVIFEVVPAEGRQDEYLTIAKDLKPKLDTIEGFISIERFASLSFPGKILSLSFWKDELAVARWRNMEEHRLAQRKGRREVFADYRLRVANVVRDYGMTERNEVPDDSQHVHDQ